MVGYALFLGSKVDSICFSISTNFFRKDHRGRSVLLLIHDVVVHALTQNAALVEEPCLLIATDVAASKHVFGFRNTIQIVKASTDMFVYLIQYLRRALLFGKYFVRIKLAAAERGL